MSQDEEHLKLLAIFHYVVGGIATLFSMLPLLHLGLGLAVVFAPHMVETRDQPPPAFIGWFFVILASCMILAGLTFAGCVITAGRNLQKRKHHTFCLIMAGIECIFMPFGTVLGVFTLIVLTKEPVKILFAARQSPRAPPAPPALG